MQLTTARLVLRELELADAPAANVYERNPDVVTYTGHRPLTLAESEARIRRAQEMQTGVPRQVYDLAVTRADDGAFVGRAGMAVGDPGERQAKLWYIVSHLAWGSGIAPEAARAVCDFGFSALGLHRIWVDIDPRNAASIRVAEKLGLRREALHLENALVNGVWTDTLIMAVLRREWHFQSAAPR